MMWLVIPVKQFEKAKSRLRSVLTEVEREALFEAMYRDVLDVACKARGFDRVTVVTSDARAAREARAVGATVIPDRCCAGHRAALTQAAAELFQHGVRSLVTIPADVPAVTRAEIEEIGAVHRRKYDLVLVPSRDRLGTNGVAVSPPNGIRFRFGNDSLVAHIAETRERGVAATILDLPGLGLDVDTPDDLRLLIAGTAGRHTVDYLGASRIADRLTTP